MQQNWDLPVADPITLDEYSETTCQVCDRPLKRRSIKSHFAIQSGYLQEYRTPNKACDNPECSNYHVFLHVDNPNIAPYHHISYEVQAEIARSRFGDRETGKEILKDLPIKTSQSTVGDIVRTYEYGCASQWDPVKIEEIKKRGFVFLHVDVIDPMKGKHGILTVHESFSKIALGTIKLVDESNEGYAEFFTGLKVIIQQIFDVPIIGVMSDALPAQRIAIENEFQGVLHCICHYHFMNYVMNDALAADEHIITQVRARLRKLRDLHDYKILKTRQKPLPFAFQVWHLFLEELIPCMDWKPKKGDPCFSSIRLLDVLAGLKIQLTRFQLALLNEEIRVDARTRKVLARLQATVVEIVQEHQATILELNAIHIHVEALKGILDNPDATLSEGLKQMEKFCRDHENRRHNPSCSVLEQNFLTQVHDYFETKRYQLFNYRLIPGAPSTNNFEESRYHMIKHHMRRTIGQLSAKEYLSRHGTRLFFVNMDAKLEEVETIFKVMNQTKARKELDEERSSRNEIDTLMHKEHAFTALNPQVDKLFEILKEQTQKEGQVKRSPREILDEKDKNGEDVTEYFLL